jgi:hypothetical protein
MEDFQDSFGMEDQDPMEEANPFEDMFVREVPGVDAVSERQNKIEELQKNNTVLKGEELDRSQYLQQTLINLLPLFPEAGVTDPEKSQKAESHQLKLEQEAKVFGPASRKAYERYVNFLQTRAVPEAVREMDSFKLPVPAGCPLTLPTDRLNRAVHPELYRAMANTNEIKANLALDVNTVPSETQLRRLDSAVHQ